MKLFSHLIKLASILPILATMLSVNLAQAAGTPAFNNLVGDQEFIQGRNITNGDTKFTNPVNANASQEVDVAVYYHNTTEGSTAKNTTIKVSLPSDFNTTHAVTATLSADGVTPISSTIVNGQTVGASALTINSSTPTQLSLKAHSVRWYNENPQSIAGPGVGLPNSQDGSTITSTGLNIGDIQGCFAHSGFVVFTVTLTGQNLPPVPTISVTKGVRPAGTTGAFISKIDGVNPGKQVEYQVVVTNSATNGAVAQDVNLADALPTGITATDPLNITISHLAAITATGDTAKAVFSKAGSLMTHTLNPGDSVAVTFVANTDSGITDKACLVNVATATSTNASNSPQQASATVCFTTPNSVLKVSKDVRKAGTTNDYVNTNRVNPGDQLQYRITVSNVDGATAAHNLNVKDVLPNQVSFVGPVTRVLDGTTTTISNDLVNQNGTIVVPDLKPLDSLQIYFVAKSDPSLANNACVVNTVIASAANASNSPQQATATTCFDVITIAPTPKPTVVTPIPMELPRTGPEAEGMIFLGVSSLGGSLARFYSLKNKLKKSWANIDIA